MNVDVDERVVSFDAFKKECFWRHEHSGNWCGIIHEECNVYKCPFVKRILASK
jgi:hypothetical protein